MLPAVGQGALGIECRDGDERVMELLLASEDWATSICVTAERAFMAAVEGSCHLPVAAYAKREGDEMWLRTMLAEDDGSRPRFAEGRIAWPSTGSGGAEEARRLGTELGKQLRE